MWIRQAPLDGVVLASQRVMELLQGGLERLEPSGVQRVERLLAANDLNRRPLLGAGFRQEQRPVLELERRQDELGPHPELLLRRAPAQATCNHQVDDEKRGRTAPARRAKVEDEAFADASYALHYLAGQRLNRGIDRPEHEWADELDALEASMDDVARQGLEVDDDVRQFRQ